MNEFNQPSSLASPDSLACICPEAWFTYPGGCYSPLKEPEFPEDAEKKCRGTEGAHLPYFKDSLVFDNRMLGGSEKSLFWTGGMFYKDGERFEWRDGTLIEDNTLPKKIQQFVMRAKRRSIMMKEMYPLVTNQKGILRFPNHEPRRWPFFCQLEVVGMQAISSRHDGT